MCAVTSAKMAATLRIQSDWSRALRWVRTVPFFVPVLVPLPAPLTAASSLCSRDEGEAWLSCRSPGEWPEEASREA